MAATLLANPRLHFLLVLFGSQSPSHVAQAPSHLLTIKTVPALARGSVVWPPLPAGWSWRTIRLCLHRVTQVFSSPCCLSHQPRQATEYKWSCSGGGEVEITRLILNMASFELSGSQPDCTSFSHTFRLRSFVARRIWVFKSHPFGMLQLDFSRDFRRRSVHAAGPLLREPERLHGTICWEASEIAAGWEVSLAPKAPGCCRVTGCPLHRLHGEQVWPGQPSCGCCRQTPW